MSFNTDLLHAGVVREANGATLPPVYQSSAFEQDTAADLEKIFENKAPGYCYTRVGNPTVTAFENRITKLEGGMASIACASGMAAIMNAILNIVRSGGEIVSSASLYGGSIDLFRDIEEFGIKTRYVKNNDWEAIEGAINEHTRLLFAETIGNPCLDVTDVERLSEIAHVIVWSIEQSGTDTFSATYEVDQQIKEGEKTSNVKATYTVKVHIDADGDMVIVQNPTLAPAIEKSDYEPKTPDADASVDADTVNDATVFLETFFKLYPTATEKELAYYVSGNVLEPIGRDYLYSELVNPIFTKDGDNVKVKVGVKFLDNQTKATQISQYELVLHKDSNWKIVG